MCVRVDDEAALRIAYAIHLSFRAPRAPRPHPLTGRAWRGPFSHVQHECQASRPDTAYGVLADTCHGSSRLGLLVTYTW